VEWSCDIQTHAITCHYSNSRQGDINGYCVADVDWRFVLRSVRPESWSFHRRSSPILSWRHMSRVVTDLQRHLRLINWSLSTFYVEDSYRCFSLISAWLYATSVLTGLSANLKQLQPVLNASARLIYGLWRFDHVLLSFHITAVVAPPRAYINSTWRSWSTEFFAATLQSTSDRSLALRCSESIITAVCIIQSSTHPAMSSFESTVGARVFPVSAGPAPWNSLPADMTSVNSLPVFRRRINNYLYCMRKLFFHWKSSTWDSFRKVYITSSKNVPILHLHFCV